MTAIVSLMITTVLEQEPERVPVSIWSVNAVSDNLRGAQILLAQGPKPEEAL